MEPEREGRRGAVGSQGFESLPLCTYGLTNPLPAHSTSTTKQKEMGEGGMHISVPRVSTSGKGFKREEKAAKAIAREGLTCGLPRHPPRT